MQVSNYTELTVNRVCATVSARSAAALRRAGYSGGSAVLSRCGAAEARQHVKYLLLSRYLTMARVINYIIYQTLRTRLRMVAACVQDVITREKDNCWLLNREC